MPSPEGLRFTKSHEWVRLEGDMATIGITDHAQEELGDVALVQFPEVGRALQKDEKFGEIESIKAVSDLYAPMAGIVAAVNDLIHDEPESVNNDPFGSGWMVRIRVMHAEEFDTLLDHDAYDDYVKGL